MDTFDAALLLLRLGVGLTFAAHGAQKIFGWWGGPGLEGWRGAMAKMGYRPVGLFAGLSALIELGGGLFVAFGLLTPIAAAALIAQSVVIIGQVHWQNGFFNGKGGYEYPLSLGLGSVAIVLLGAGAWSLDAVLGFAAGATASVALIILGLVAGAVVLTVPRLGANAAAHQG
ncbi:MAG TPA: DoxX family protein [Candidatus Limnocylindrales bacterium]|nr:DoxX family protein [Candidatus Limnocylindrales bacterium]